MMDDIDRIYEKLEIVAFNFGIASFFADYVSLSESELDYMVEQGILTVYTKKDGEKRYSFRYHDDKRARQLIKDAEIDISRVKSNKEPYSDALRNHINKVASEWAEFVYYDISGKRYNSNDIDAYVYNIVTQDDSFVNPITGEDFMQTVMYNKIKDILQNKYNI